MTTDSQNLSVEASDAKTANTGSGMAGLKPWTKKAPLLPEAGAAGAPLTVVVTVICFLASLALTGFFSVSKATKAWTSDLNGSITVQIKGQSPDNIILESEKVLAFLSTAEGVISAKSLSRTETGKLLEPWLGRNNIPADLPVPGLVEVAVTDVLRRDLSALASQINQISSAATLDDHGTWNASLAASANAVRFFAFGVFVLVMGAVCTVIIFATRAGLAANRDIIAVLHLVGATDMFIANEVQRRFLVLGLRGSLAGVGISLASILLLAFALGQQTANTYFLPSITADFSLLLWLAIVPLLTCLVAAWSARTTVLKTLEERF